MLLLNIISLIARYLHIVCTTLLVGGTLFYELVVPIAIEDLKPEHQFNVFGRARWGFRWIVWISAILIVISGMISTFNHWPVYSAAEHVMILPTTEPTSQPYTQPVLVRPGWWWAAHTSVGLVSVLVAVVLTTGRRLPDRPVQWMRLNLMILMIVMFLATATRHIRLLAEEQPGVEMARSSHHVPE